MRLWLHLHTPPGCSILVIIVTLNILDAEVHRCCSSLDMLFPLSCRYVIMGCVQLAQIACGPAKLLGQWETRFHITHPRAHLIEFYNDAHFDMQNESDVGLPLGKSYLSSDQKSPGQMNNSWGGQGREESKMGPAY
ncbi:unnamed protein product [Protopolystoma xenopodis]|uniref:Uncharacterized protein n=1 Tax=Protopolystoma xenopodis TaxID=117903 RepID=A0A448WCE3_9PLAT|nr:unnamed protein product [Protopolystoma xenopodis]